MMYYLTRSILSLGLLLLLISGVVGQSVDNHQLYIVIPPSPDASSLGKYGETPVSYSTGVPNITVSMYSISQKNMEVPIAVSYHAGGIKVEESSSWVGLGWSLNAGGVITRSMVGLPDEDGYLYLTYEPGTLVDSGESTQLDVADRVRQATMDVEPDRFFFNFLHFSGQFFIDRVTGKPVIIPLNPGIDISFTITSNTITSWKIKDSKGNVYEFGAAEITRSMAISGSRPGTPPPIYRSTWYLIKATNIFGEQIIFNYDSYSSNYYTRQSSSKYIFLSSTSTNCTSPQTDNANFDHITVTGKRIRSIQFANGLVEFIRSDTNRLDIVNDYWLDSIRVTNNNGRVIKAFNFRYSYFNSDNFRPTNLPVPYTTKRLKLDSIIEGPIAEKNIHVFDYYSGNLPSVFSFAQDHWGYYNAKSNTSLLPLVFQGSGAATSREVKESAAIIGTLKQIRYPTGGSSNFYFNVNQAAITENEYTNHFAPYGGSSEEYKENIGAYVFANDSSFRDTLYVDPKTVEIDYLHNNFEYDIFLNNTDTCDGGDKPCNSSVRIRLVCADCVTPETMTYDLHTMSNFVGGVARGKLKLVLGRTYYLIKSSFGAPSSDWELTAASVRGQKEVFPAASNNLLTIQTGGLRIDRIVDSSLSAPPIVTKFYYNTADTSDPATALGGDCSGTLNGYPRYDYLQEFLVRTETEVGTFTSYCYYKVISSGSLMPLAASGSSVNYAVVNKVRLSETERQRSLYKFTTSAHAPDTIITAYPYTVKRSSAYKRALPVEEKNFSFKDTSYSLINESFTKYQFLSLKTLSGLKVACNSMVQGGSLNGSCANTILQNYDLASEWVQKIADSTITYSQDGNQKLIDRVEYLYDNPLHQLPTQVKTTNSRGEIILEQSMYPLDYDTSLITNPDANFVTTAARKHVFTALEKSKYVINADGSNKRLTESAFLKLKPLLPIADSLFLINTRMPLAGFTQSAINSGEVKKDNRYQDELYFLAYDNAGNIVEQQKKNGNLQSYIWDYQHQYPIAEVNNTAQAYCAYTSFEADGAGNWTINSSVRDTAFVTGARSYQLSNGAISKEGLSASTTYMLSYWTKNSSAFTITGTQGSAVQSRTVSEWKLFIHRITGVSQVALSGTGLIDELRLYPANAQMATYTYEPLVGITNQCDANNRIMYYEYDALGRLKLIRDQDKNILKTFRYTYQEQQ